MYKPILAMSLRYLEGYGFRGKLNEGIKARLGKVDGAARYY